jgi:hypothetical protein
MENNSVTSKIKGFFSGEIGGSIILVALIFLALLTFDTIYNVAKSASSRYVTLMDYTASSETMPLRIYQDAAKYPTDAKVIGLSVNERTGIEFAYSFFLNIFPSTFDAGEDTLKHVFHKGNAMPWPLMGPGVFIRGHQNTMRVFMNTYKNPYTYVDITNIPVQKWFHVVLNCNKSGLDVYINGKLATRLSFHDTIPYQNFQDIHMFSTMKYNFNTQIPALEGATNFKLDGAFKGQMSRFVYTRYALSTSEIARMMAQGPSSEIKEKKMDHPPYFSDDWWANQY